MIPTGDAGAVQIVPPGQLVWGMQLPVQAQSSVFAAPWELAAGPEDLLAVARACDRNGFFYVAVCDHVCVPRDRADAMRTTWYDTVATLGWLAASTSRVRLLSHVFVLAVGAGHLEAEFAALGVDFRRRGRLLDEAIETVRAAFLDEFLTRDGQGWTARDVGVRPRPVQRPRPPIWVGGSTPAALRRAAERGDGWLPQGTPRSEIPAAIETIRAHRRTTIGDRPIEIGTISEWMYVGRPPFEVPANTRSGSPEELADHLRALKPLGVNHCGVRFRARSREELVDQIDAFGSRVAPLVNA